MLMMLSVSAHALDIEIGTGATHYKTAHDGLWYQEAYAHSFDLKSTPMSFGVSHEYKGIRYRAQYLYLGQMFSNAVWVSDNDYVVGSALKEPDYIGNGTGRVSGIILSASRPALLFGLPFYVEAGPFFYVPTWKVTILRANTREYLYDLETTSQWRVGPSVGFGIRHSGIDISVKYLGMQHRKNEPYPTIYDRAYMLDMKVYF